MLMQAICMCGGYILYTWICACVWKLRSFYEMQYVCLCVCVGGAIMVIRDEKLNERRLAVSI